MSSALTRAGISFPSIATPFRCWFRPHKGGYITQTQSGCKKLGVPPSQGRVYRKMEGQQTTARRSALTRAGISFFADLNLFHILFRPHKGGYIENQLGRMGGPYVPPSQGRVYRSGALRWAGRPCSALTRAGISRVRRLQGRQGRFRPHKGGYIENCASACLSILVPPSQGRVYRKDFRLIR